MKKKFQLELDVSAEQAWVAVGDKFGETGQWTSLLDSSRMEGDIAVGGCRVCLDGRRTFTEHITAFDAKNMTLEYELVTGRPFIIKSARNSWSIRPLSSNSCLVIMKPSIELKWWAICMLPVLSLGLSSTLKKVMEELEYWVERGIVHPRKKAKK